MVVGRSSVQTDSTVEQSGAFDLKREGGAHLRRNVYRFAICCKLHASD